MMRLRQIVSCMCHWCSRWTCPSAMDHTSPWLTPRGSFRISISCSRNVYPNPRAPHTCHHTLLSWLRSDNLPMCHKSLKPTPHLSFTQFPQQDVLLNIKIFGKQRFVLIVVMFCKLFGIVRKHRGGRFRYWNMRGLVSGGVAALVVTVRRS